MVLCRCLGVARNRRCLELVPEGGGPESLKTEEGGIIRAGLISNYFYLLSHIFIHKFTTEKETPWSSSMKDIGRLQDPIRTIHTQTRILGQQIWFGPLSFLLSASFKTTDR